MAKKNPSAKLRIKNSSKKVGARKKKQEYTFEYFRWLSIGFAIASVGIAIAGVLLIITSSLNP